jgi:hypothetical protein
MLDVMELREKALREIETILRDTPERGDFVDDLAQQQDEALCRIHEIVEALKLARSLRGPRQCPKGHVPILHRSEHPTVGIEFGYACACDKAVGLYRSEAEALRVWDASVKAGVDVRELRNLLAKVEQGGPHEWGYRDVTDGTFVADDWPFKIAGTLPAIFDALDEAARIRERVERLEAALTRVRAAIEFADPRDDIARRKAMAGDLQAGMSLRKCAAKHGVSFGVVRGLARAQKGAR